MQKIFDTVHDDFKTVVASPDRTSGNDYDIDLIKGFPNEDFRRSRYKEYEKMGFPIWKRLSISAPNLPPFPPRGNFDANLQSIMECEDVTFFETLDFEGSDRKYVLLSDIFHVAGVCDILRRSGAVRVEGQSIDSSLFIVEGSVDLQVFYKTSFRVSNMRFLIKKGSFLRLTHLALTEEFGVENLYFYLEEGASLFLEELVVSNGKHALAVMIKGEKDSKAEVLPRVAAASGGVDVLYWNLSDEGSLCDVKGKGLVGRNGKIIFRGVVDIKRGFKGGAYSEHFSSLLLSDTSVFEAIPSLFVSESEISASHGVSSSPIDDEKLFYVMSKGFEREEAVRMIAEGFIMDLEFPEEAKEFSKFIFDMRG